VTAQAGKKEAAVMTVETAAASDVKAAVEAALPLVRDGAGEAERTGRLSDDVVAALRATGINRLAIPRALGGLEAPVLDMMDVVERLGAADGSTAWCAVIAFGSNVFAGYLPEDGARRVYADPDQGNATMFAPLGTVDGDGEGGAPRLSGRWPFASNCLHSSWIGLGAMPPDGADPIPRVVFVPMADVTVEPTWDSAGLRGTGSHHVRADGVAIDRDHSCSFADRPWPEGTLWRLPLYAALLPLLTAVPLGIARGALDEVGRQAREGRTARRGQLVDDPVSMNELAVAELCLRGARAALRELVAEARELAERGDPVDRKLQATIVLACLQACDASVEVTSTAHLLGGGAAAYAGSPLLRALCDVQAARQHLLFAHKHRAELAKALVGLDVIYPPFVT
jgi:alkylation response protein AidB-like acyl-CoA dehydrogenase